MFGSQLRHWLYLSRIHSYLFRFSTLPTKYFLAIRNHHKIMIRLAAAFVALDTQYAIMGRSSRSAMTAFVTDSYFVHHLSPFFFIASSIHPSNTSGGINTFSSKNLTPLTFFSSFIKSCPSIITTQSSKFRL